MLNAFQSNHSRSLFSALSSCIPSFARDSKFIQRASKLFCPSQFLLALINSVNSGKGSLHQIAVQLSLISGQSAITPQAIHERLHRTELGAESFLVRCLAFIFAKKFTHSATVASPFRRILVEDSTQLALHAHLADEFPGHGNDHGDTAGCKIDFCFDLLSGATLIHELHTATTQDKTLGSEILDFISPNDLVLRDMGYFAIPVFIEIESKQAYWLSRLPRNVQASDQNGVALETLLAEATTETLDIAVSIGKKAEHPVRLLAQKCSEEERRNNRRTMRANYKKQGKTPTKAQLTRCDWHLMVTNVPATMQSQGSLYEIYRQRWQIELVFRGWKKSHSLAKLHKQRTSATHVKVLVLAAMIVMSITIQLARVWQREMSEEERKYFSLEKLFEVMSQIFVKLHNLEELENVILDKRHLKSAKRKRKSLIYQCFTTLA